MQNVITQAFATLLSTLNLKIDLQERVEETGTDIATYRTDDNKLVFSCFKFDNKDFASTTLNVSIQGLRLFVPVKELNISYGDNSDVIGMSKHEWSRALLTAFPEVKEYATTVMTYPDETVNCRYFSIMAVTEEDDLILMTFLETEQELTREKSKEIMSCTAAAAAYHKYLENLTATNAL